MMAELINWVRRVLGLRRPSYVIIYDLPGTDRTETVEEYYGYFSDPAEARHLWRDFSAGQQVENVKLCRIVEDW